MVLTDIEKIKIEIREEQIPFFTEEEIEYFLGKNGGNVKDTIYELLILKSEDSTLSVSGMNTTDTSKYFKRLASRFRSFNSGILSTS